MVKIFHSGDFHLDSAYAGLDFARSEQKRKLRRELFEKMLTFAKEDGCGIILLSGDIFDGTYVTKETETSLLSLFAALEIPVVISPGNHDPYLPESFYASAKMPENVYIFKSEDAAVFKFPDLNLAVFGYAFTSDSHPAPDFSDIISAESDFEGGKILLAHSDLDIPDSKYAPIEKSRIAEWGFMYAALGHVHKEPELILENGSYISYCGFPEGRGFDELGKGGAWILQADTREGKLSAERRSFSDVRFEADFIDLTGISEDNPLAQEITRLVKEKNYDENTNLRIVLKGSLDADFSPNIQLVRSFVLKKTPLAELEIKDETVPNLSDHVLEKDLSIRGEIFRTLLPELRSQDPRVRRTAREALRFALRALEGEYYGTEAGIHENIRN